MSSLGRLILATVSGLVLGLSVYILLVAGLWIISILVGSLFL